MLVLSRFTEQEIVFPDLNISVKVLRVKDTGAVSLGISAPANIRCHRKEIQDKIDSNVPNVISGNQPKPVRIWQNKTPKKTARKGDQR
jgi:carbon storage regulator CsrA